MAAGMDSSIYDLVERIHASSRQAVVTLAGTGGQALAWLLGVPGASRTVLEALVPYGQQSMVELLGHEPDQYVSMDTARELARWAYQRGVKLNGRRDHVIGVGCTASIATDRPKRGEHRCCVATHDSLGVNTYDVVLGKGTRSRAEEEEVASRLVLNALARACEIESELPLGLALSERLEVQQTLHPDPLERLLAPDKHRSTDEEDKRVASGEAPSTVTVHPDGRMSEDEPFSGALLPGSFSPLHEGHERLAKVAPELMMSGGVAFEISILNVDKPPLGLGEVRSRLAQFRGKWAVVLTRARTFVEKAALFPGCTFVIGWDTAVRLMHPRYYEGGENEMLEALTAMREAGCKVLVAGRVQDGVFHTLDDIDIPRGYGNMFSAVPEDRFRVDVSSTELRAAGGERWTPLSPPSVREDMDPL